MTFETGDGCIIAISCKTAVFSKGGQQIKKKKKPAGMGGPAVRRRRPRAICFGCVSLMGRALPRLNLVLLAGFYRCASITAERRSSRDVEMSVRARRMYSSLLFILMGLPLGGKQFHAYFFKLDNRRAFYFATTSRCVPFNWERESSLESSRHFLT